MNRVLRAFGKALFSQLHPRMLALLLIPFVVAIVFWLLVGWFVWDPLVTWLRVEFFETEGVVRWLFTQAARFGLDGLEGAIVLVAALMLLLPLMFVTALLLIAVFAMPVVNQHLGSGPYRDVDRRGSWSVRRQPLERGVERGAVPGRLRAQPALWLFPLLGLLLPWLCWSWLTARVMRFDSLVEHADPDERRALIARRREAYFGLSLLVTALNYIPPLFLITPVLTALAFGHYSLSAVREARAAVGREVGTAWSPGDRAELQTLNCPLDKKRTALMNFGLIIIGDEILSGKRQDKHFAKVLELMSARGLSLGWVTYLGDDRARLVDTLRPASRPATRCSPAAALAPRPTTTRGRQPPPRSDCRWCCTPRPGG